MERVGKTLLLGVSGRVQTEENDLGVIALQLGKHHFIHQGSPGSTGTEKGNVLSLLQQNTRLL